MDRPLDPTPTIKPERLAHFVLRTRNLEQAIAFYQTLIGMEVVHRNDFLAFLTFDDEHHRLALAQTPVQEPAPPGAAGLDHTAFTYASLGDLLQNYKRLHAKGIDPVWSINHGPTTSMYYQDPDGNRVECQVENFASVEEANAWMRSETFQKNPLGIEFDPEKLLARYERGDPIEELIQQGSA